MAAEDNGEDYTSHPWEQRDIPEIPGMEGREVSDESALDPDYRTEDDVLELINEELGAGISEAELQEIKDFLVNINVRNAEIATWDEISILWNQLKGNTSLVKDFIYSLLHAKERLNHSEYPLALSLDETVEYAVKLKSPNDIRPWLIAETSPHISRLGFDSRSYVDRALSESRDPRIGSDATRFLGYLVSRRFMYGLNLKKKEFIKKHKPESFTIPNLATITTITLSDHLASLEKTSDRYNPAYIMERDSKPVHDDAVLALRGLYRMCGILFLTKGGRPVQK